MKPHKNISAPMLAAIGAGVLVGLLFLSYVLSSGLLHARDTGITLPDGSADTPVVSQGSHMLTAQSVADVEIGTYNAQSVIASLTRPTTYSCSIENTLYYTGGSSALRCRRYAREGVVRTDTLTASGSVQSILIRDGETAYAWNTGDRTVYQGAWGDFSDDAAAMLPTYEDVLGEGVALISAGRQDVDFEPCIMVEFEQGGYRCVYYVSAATGLLKTASFYSGDTLTRQVTVSNLQTDTPDEALFTLPDGTKLLGE
ncbi:MAG TPA: hypothetical protein H9745_06945 [Candidatus Agathobaculum stercoravium]|nr:hypothetical protein [Candidatus Agathobaculum stercoravium]